MPGTGGNIRVLLGSQGTSKTVKATIALNLLKASFDAAPNYNKKDSPVLTGTLLKRKNWTSSMSAGGSFSFVLTRDQLIAILPYLGMEISGTVTTVDTWEPAASITQWATIGIEHLDADCNFYEIFVGCRFSTIKFTLVAESEIMVDVTFESLDYEAPVINTTTSISTIFTTINEVTDDELTNLDIAVTADASDIADELISLDVEISTNLKTDDRSINTLIRRNLDAQDWTATFTMKTDLLYTTYTAYTAKAVANTSMDVSVTIGTKIVMSIPEFTPGAPTKPITSRDKVEVTIDGEGFSESASSPLSFAIDTA